MKLELLAVGTRSPGWVATGFKEYQSRFPRDWQVDVKEIPVSRLGKSARPADNKAEEARRLLAAIQPDRRVVALDVEGDVWSTPQLASNLDKWRHEYRGVQLLIGGPDGLADECLQAAHNTWSLSRLTFPHFMVRVLLAEQLYRAWSIISNHPYHR